MHDPIVEEVRKVRKDIDKEFSSNPEEYYLHLQKLQKKLKNRLVKKSPKPALKKKAG